MQRESSGWIGDDGVPNRTVISNRAHSYRGYLIGPYGPNCILLVKSGPLQFGMAEQVEELAR
jgi:hypothetical protein